MEEEDYKTPILLRFRRFRLSVRVLLALVAGLVLLAGLRTSGSFLRKEEFVFLVFLLPVALVLWRRRSAESDSRTSLLLSSLTPGLVLTSLLVLALFTSYNQHSWFYFLNWSGSGVLSLGVVQFVLFTALLTPLVLHRFRHVTRWMLVLLLAMQALCLVRFLGQTGGAPLLRDDHASFVFRLWEFGSTFPQLINYTPYWNGGIVTHHGTSTGTAAIGMAAWPFLQIWGPEKIYTWFVAFYFLVAAPWITVGSLRLMRLPLATALIGGVFALGVSRQFLLWLLHYGTTAGNFSLMFLIPMLAALYRILHLGKTEWWTGLILAGSVYMLLLWPLAGVIVFLIAICVVLHAGKLTWRKTGLLAAGAVLFSALYAKNLLVIMNYSGTFKKSVAAISASDNAPRAAITFSTLR